MSRFVDSLRMARRGMRLTVQRSRTLLSGADTLGYIGGQGAKNLGDDAMFEAVRHLLSPSTVLAYSYTHLERRLRHVGLSGKSVFRHFLLGGGTLINPYPLWIEQAEQVLDEGIPMWALGTGVGSFGFDMDREVSLERWVPLLTRFEKIGVRGPISLQMLNEVGISNAEIVGDLALSLTRDEVCLPQDPPCIAVNLSVPTPDDYGRGDYSCLRELEIVLPELKRAGWKIVPIIMHQRDIAPTRQLFAAFEQENDPMPLLTRADQFFERVAPCTFTISVRLHAAVLSTCVGVPPLMLGYRDKCLDFMESMGMEEWYVPLHQTSGGEIREKVSILAQQGATMRNDVLHRAQHWRDRLRQYVQPLISKQ